MLLIVFYSVLLLVFFAISIFAYMRGAKSLYAGTSIVSIVIMFVIIAIAYDCSKHVTGPCEQRGSNKHD